LAIFAAIRRASSRVRLVLGSQTWFGFFSQRCGSPAALPITAPFFFERKTAGLIFVRRCWPQSFCWLLFCRLSREDAAADYECAHDCPENPKWNLLHCGVLRRPTPLRAIIRPSTHQVLRNSSGNLAKLAAIRRASSRELFGLSLTALISSRVRSYTPRIAVDLSFQRVAVAEPRARKRLGLVRGRSLTLRVSPNAEWRRPTTNTPKPAIKTSQASSFPDIFPRSTGPHCTRAAFRSYRGASFRVVPSALWHTPCVMTSLAGPLESQTAADNESNHQNDSE